MHVLVTRPKGDGETLKAEIERLGCEVSLEPLIRIVPNEIPQSAIDGASTLIVTSRNALKALAPSPALAAAMALPLMTVGPGTAALALEMGFKDVFEGRYPGEWSAVSWEYAAILQMWKVAVERARTIEPLTVLAMMKVGGKGKHVFGEATWWGRELFGIDNALVGDWPVVTIRNGRARIVEFGSPLAWWSEHGDLLIKHMRALNLMWDQREERLALSR
jgi:hypothetical protein